MIASYSILRRMLYVEKLNYKRQCCSLVSLSATFIVFTMHAIGQCGLLNWLGKSYVDFWITIDFISVIMAALSLICGIMLVFFVEREKRKLRKEIEKESKIKGLKSRIVKEKEKKELVDRISDVIEDSGHKVDLFASVLNFMIQFSTFAAMLSLGISLSNEYKVGKIQMSAVHVADMVSNSAYFLSALLFALSHIIIHRNKKEFTDNHKRQSNIMLIFFVGNLMVLAGKVVCALESVKTIETAPMPWGGTFPTGWVIRVIGIALCVAGFIMVMGGTSKKCDELSETVERGEGASEVMSLLSTHEVRSCFGYLEYGTR